MTQESSCFWDDVAASKACVRPTPANPRNALAFGFSACNLRKLDIAYIRAWRMSIWAWRYLEMIGTCPSTAVRNHLWNDPHLASKKEDDTHPAWWFGQFNQNFLNRMRAVTHALASRFRYGVLKYNGHHPVEFHFVKNQQSLCSGNVCGEDPAVGCHTNLGKIKLCENIFSWSEDEIDDGKPGTRSYAASIIVHELMHKLYPSQVHPDLADQQIPGLNTHAERGIAWYLVDPLIVNPPRPDLATLNIESYAAWFMNLYFSMEKSCALYTHPVWKDGKTPFYYVNNKWRTTPP